MQQLYPGNGEIVIEKATGTQYIVTRAAYVGAPTTLRNRVDGETYGVYLYDDFWHIEPSVVSQADAIMDMVNQPAHYKFDNGVEVMDLAEQLNYCRGNVVKYVSRAGRKSADTELEDLRKAEVYLKREIARVEKLREDI